MLRAGPADVASLRVRAAAARAPGAWAVGAAAAAAAAAAVTAVVPAGAARRNAAVVVVLRIFVARTAHLSFTFQMTCKHMFTLTYLSFPNFWLFQITGVKNALI